MKQDGTKLVLQQPVMVCSRSDIVPLGCARKSRAPPWYVAQSPPKGTRLSCINPQLIIIRPSPHVSTPACCPLHTASHTSPYASHRYLPHAFVVNTVNVEGPILCLPETWLLWDVKGYDDITPASLALLDLVDPPPEVVVIGCGSKIRPLHPLLQKHLHARGIAVEALDTVSIKATVFLL